MAQLIKDTYLFHLARATYKRTRKQGWLWCGGYLLCAALALFASFLILPTYQHVWTPYLKWQDALVALLWFIALLGLAGATFVVRFLYALRESERTGVLHLVKDHALAIRDLAHENFISIFWMLHAAFWCFVAGLIGLSPETLLKWTLHLPNPLLMVTMMTLVSLLSLAGLAVSVVTTFFIIVGTLGLIKVCRNLGALYTYKLNNRTVVRLDGPILTVIYPDMPEAILDLNTLALADREQLTQLLQASPVEVQHDDEQELAGVL